MPTFKSKKEHAAHLLQKGVTTQEMLTALGWPSISMPAMAKSLGMKLEKVKENGVTKYKGTPMTDAEKSAEKGKAAAPKVTSTPATAQELEKAKKTAPLKLQYVPGAPQNNPEAQKLVDEFNKKYSEKPATTPAALQQKVDDFKQMQAAMIPIAAGEQQKAAQAAAEAAEKAKINAQKQKAAAEAEAKAAATKNKEVMGALGISEVEALGFDALAKMMGGNKDDIVKSFQSYEAQAKKYGYPITGFRCALIKNYTNGGYTSINQALRNGQSYSAAQHLYVKSMNKALKSMPTFKGVTRRGASLSAHKQADYKVGNVVEESAFTSTSPSKPWSGNTQFTINAIGQRSARVKKLSSHGAEDEVVFAARTFFHVDKVETIGGVMHVTMTETEHE